MSPHRFHKSKGIFAEIIYSTIRFAENGHILFFRNSVLNFWAPLDPMFFNCSWEHFECALTCITFASIINWCALTKINVCVHLMLGAIMTNKTQSGLFLQWKKQCGPFYKYRHKWDFFSLQNCLEIYGKLGYYLHPNSTFLSMSFSINGSLYMIE